MDSGWPAHLMGGQARSRHRERPAGLGSGDGPGGASRVAPRRCCGRGGVGLVPHRSTESDVERAQ